MLSALVNRYRENKINTWSGMPRDTDRPECPVVLSTLKIDHFVSASAFC
jgi:hypothetical protein